MNSRWALALMVLACAGCRQDMQRQPKYTPLSRSWFYSDGRSARPIPEGTFAVDAPIDDTPLLTGKENGAFVTTIPVPVTGALLDRGRDRFDIYCSPCHAFVGDGKGMVARRGFQQPADLNGARVRNAPPGYLYAVIAHGYGAMAAYAYQIQNPQDRWAIVAYIRALELSRAAPLDEVPANERTRLEAQP